MHVHVQLNIRPGQRNRPSIICSQDMRYIALEMQGQIAEMKAYFFLRSGMNIHNMVLSPSANSKILLNNVCNITTSILCTFKSFLSLQVFQMNLHYFKIFSISHWPFLSYIYVTRGCGSFCKQCEAAVSDHPS